MQEQLSEWNQNTAEVLAQSPGQSQLRVLTSWLQRLALSDHVLLFIYADGHPPLALFHTLAADLRHLFIREYQGGSYSLDPFYLACVSGQADGLYSMRRLAPEHFHTTPYYCSYYRHLELSEQLGFIVTLGEQGRAVLSLMRRRGQAAFSGEELQLLHSAAPVVDQVVRAAWEAHRQQGPQGTSGPVDKVAEVFEQFGRGVLTRREGEVARLLLEGHSNLSVSQQLGIGPGTVRTHRQSLYKKLGVGCQAELLALFVHVLKRA